LVRGGYESLLAYFAYVATKEIKNSKIGVFEKMGVPG
jgi:hypothetical protein